MSKSRGSCFVIMPIGKTSDKHTEEYWTGHFESFFKPLIEEDSNLEAYRSEALRGDMLTQIITALVTSRIVVADLTDLNPNVFWELGVRQSFTYGTVTVAEIGTKLPFDVGRTGTLSYYPKNHIKTSKFRKQFKKAIKDCLAHPDRPDSHVLETLSGRGTLFEVFRKDETLRRLDALLQECDRNLRTFVGSMEVAKANLAEQSKHETPTVRLRLPAVDLLLTSRYIDEEEAFFESADKYAGYMLALNSQLDIWEHRPRVTEKYLVKNEELFVESIKEFRAKIKETRNRLS